ncbi:His-Xaa-Ser system radical SAM maturase HxsB [Hyphomonas jannaschiana]|uniref:His-Xaa-Ser system radical SAM maturase HxsB n=1 Tax=Hyphomonas jannaschiana TaxID=86 RepID=UPI0035C72935
MAKFTDLQSYSDNLAAGYKPLPFRFMPLNSTKYVLTNMAGEFIVTDRESLATFSEGRLSHNSSLYDELKSKHFLIDSDSDVALDLLALKVRTKLSPLANFTGLHIFVVTLRCEHSCPYCQVSRANDNRTDFDMTEDTASRALDLVFQSPSPAIKIEFQGGESLLNLDLIEFIINEAKRRNEVERRDLAFVFATNLAVLDERALEIARQHGVFISTSLDGPQDLHNKNRPRPGGDSYERTITGINRARAIVGRDHVSALMTTTAASLDRSRDIIDEYIRQGFRGIFLRALSPYGFALKTKFYQSYNHERWLNFYFEGLDYIIELNKSGFNFSEQYASMILRKMLTPFQPGYVDLMSPSGIGIGAVVYNYDGDVYASDEARMLAEMNDKTFKLGNVHEDDYEDIFLGDSLLDPIEKSFAPSTPMCSWCAFEPWCGSDPVFHHATQGDCVGKKPYSAFCGRNMAIFKGLVERMNDDPETRRIFEDWANG